jgi:hypothetical protein
VCYCGAILLHLHIIDESEGVKYQMQNESLAVKCQSYGRSCGYGMGRFLFWMCDRVDMLPVSLG